MKIDSPLDPAYKFANEARQWLVFAAGLAIGAFLTQSTNDRRIGSALAAVLAAICAARSIFLTRKAKSILDALDKTLR